MILKPGGDAGLFIWAAHAHGKEHIAMQEHQGGEHVMWLEPVSDEQYAATPTG